MVEMGVIMNAVIVADVIPGEWSQIQAAYKLHKMFTDSLWGNFTQSAPLKQSHLEQNQNKVLSNICKQHIM